MKYIKIILCYLGIFYFSSLQLQGQVFNTLHETTASKGFEWESNYILESFTNLYGGITTGSNLYGNLNLSGTLDLNRSIGLKNTSFGFNAMAMHGKSISELVGDELVISNIDADPTFRFQNLWIEHQSMDSIFSIRFGKQAIDDEFYTTDLCGFFLHAVPGLPMTLSGNAPQWPVSGLALLLKYARDEQTTFRLGIYNSDARVTDESINNNGLSFLFDPTGYLIIGEVELGLDRTLAKVGFIHDTNEYPDENSNLKDGLTALHLIFDYQLSQTNEGEGLFCMLTSSYAFQRDTAPFDYELGGALNWKFSGKNGFDRELGITYFYPHVGKVANASSLLPVRTEQLLELSYKYVPNEIVEFQSSIQHIINPGGSTGITIPNAWLAGIRATINL